MLSNTFVFGFFPSNFYHSQYYVVNCLFSKRIYLSVVFKKNIFIYCFQKEYIHLLFSKRIYLSVVFKKNIFIYCFQKIYIYLLFSKMISTHYLWLSKNLKNKHLKYDINKWVFFYRQDGISVVLISNRSSYRPVLEPYISDSWINRI